MAADVAMKSSPGFTDALRAANSMLKVPSSKHGVQKREVR
jgi:hypothetical protein